MSSPITPRLFLDDTGKLRIELSGYVPIPFATPENDADSRFYQGKNFPQSLKKIGNPNEKVTEEEAMDALRDTVKYYNPKKK